MEQKEPNFYATIKDAALLAVKEIAEIRAERNAALLRVGELTTQKLYLSGTVTEFEEKLATANRLISEKNEEIAALKERSKGPLHGQQMEKQTKEPQTECVSCGSIVQISGDTLCRKCGGGRSTEGQTKAPQICLVQIGCMGGTCGEPLPCANHPTVLKRNCPSCGAVGPCECK